MTTPNPDFTESRLVAIGRELDLLGANGRQLSRRMIVELAYGRGYAEGYHEGLGIAREAMEALLARKVDDGR